ncbi:MAG: hypothetical protein KAJ03_07495 [Gammaproteobacteria bacterium]|nr:hypothetical protein [Gammaproteobacteria bacterium]
MDIINNGSVLIKNKYESLRAKDCYMSGMHRVTIECEKKHAVVSWAQGGLVPMYYDSVHVRHSPFDLFGLIKYKPFCVRLQNAVDDMQHRCDQYDLRTIQQYEMNQKLNHIAPATQPQGGSGVPPKQNFANNEYTPPTITPEDARL